MPRIGPDDTSTTNTSDQQGNDTQQSREERQRELVEGEETETTTEEEQPERQQETAQSEPETGPGFSVPEQSRPPDVAGQDNGPPEPSQQQDRQTDMFGVREAQRRARQDSQTQQNQAPDTVQEAQRERQRELRQEQRESQPETVQEAQRQSQARLREAQQTESGGQTTNVQVNRPPTTDVDIPQPEGDVTDVDVAEPIATQTRTQSTQAPRTQDIEGGGLPVVGAVEATVEGAEQRLDGPAQSIAETTTGAAGDVRSFSASAFADPTTEITDVGDRIVPESIERDVESAGRELAETGRQVTDPIGTGVSGSINLFYNQLQDPLDPTPLDDAESFEDLEQGSDVVAGQDISGAFDKAITGSGELAATPADVAGFGIETTEAVGAFGSELAEGNFEGAGEVAEQAGVGATATGIGVVGGFVRNPFEATGQLAASAGVGAVASPVRFSRVDVPTRSGSGGRTIQADIETQRLVEGVADDTPSVSAEITETGTQTLRGVRVETPPVVDRFTDRNFRGRTLFGTRDKRPTVGTPTVDVDDVDFRQMGRGKSQQGNVFEPQSRFETDVFTSSAAQAGGDVGGRIGAVESVLDESETITGRARTGEVDDIEPVLRDVEELSSDVDTGELADALAESEATIFGSGAVRAQAPDFRAPKDLDIVVPDAGEARRQIGDVVEGTDTSLQAFDIKEPGDFAGLEGGEVFGFGRRSQDPIETERGVRTNPIGEELQRKAGASGFFRGRGQFSEDVDVGPRPNPGGRPRTKDVTDTAAIGRELLGEDNPAIRDFETAFGLREGIDTPSGGFLPDFDTGLQRFRADTEGRIDLGQRRPRDTETGARTRPRDTDTERPRQRGDAESPTRSRTDTGGSRTPFGSSPFASRFGVDTRAPFGGSSPPQSPEADSTTGGPFGSPTGQGPSDVSSPPTGDSPSPNPFGPPFGSPGSPDFGSPDIGSPSSPGGSPPPSPPPFSPPTSSPPSSPPGSPPSSAPNSPPGSPPSTVPGAPFGTQPVAQNRRTVRADRETTDDEEELPEIGPAGQEFTNPVASGSAFLFGTGIGDATGQQATTENVLPGGPGTPSEPILSGAVEPPELFEGAFINDS